jgi:hypothetical protein
LSLAFKLTETVPSQPVPQLTILRLKEEQLGQVYPLVRTAARVGPERWDSFGRELIAGGGGIVAAQAGGDCFHGVAAFRTGGSLRHPHSLRVELLVAVELSPRAPVRRALCAALADLARAQECDSIVFTVAAPRVPGPACPVPPDWEALGVRMESADFVQKLDGRGAGFGQDDRIPASAA